MVGPGNPVDAFTIPWRNYLIALTALAFCEQGQIPTCYITMGYYDDGGIWDNKPEAFTLLQQFVDQVAANRSNLTAATRLISPTVNKSRRAWVQQEIAEGYPYQLTWSGHVGIIADMIWLKLSLHRHRVC